MTPSRQVRRANERLALKMAQSSYPKGLTTNRYSIQRYEPFEPRGANYRGDENYGRQEAARRTGIPN